MTLLITFLVLQYLDFGTTLLGFRFGASEASPVLAHLFHGIGPVTGLALDKFFAVGLFGIALTRKSWLVKWSIRWYRGLVMWNMACIMYAMYLHT